jgi:hypothetical protein
MRHGRVKVHQGHMPLDIKAAWHAPVNNDKPNKDASNTTRAGPRQLRREATVHCSICTTSDGPTPPPDNSRTTKDSVQSPRAAPYRICQRNLSLERYQLPRSGPSSPMGFVYLPHLLLCLSYQFVLLEACRDASLKLLIYDSWTADRKRTSLPGRCNRLVYRSVRNPIIPFGLRDACAECLSNSSMFGVLLTGSTTEIDSLPF